MFIVRQMERIICSEIGREVTMVHTSQKLRVDGFFIIHLFFFSPVFDVSHFNFHFHIVFFLICNYLKVIASLLLVWWFLSIIYLWIVEFWCLILFLLSASSDFLVSYSEGVYYYDYLYFVKINPSLDVALTICVSNAILRLIVLFY